MADMGTGPGEPLAASIGEQLHEKARLDMQADEERARSDPQHERIERRKADEREAALRHSGVAPGSSRLRVSAWTPVRALAVAAVVGGMFLVWRRSRT